jgi:hypothetical protein
MNPPGDHTEKQHISLLYHLSMYDTAADVRRERQR